MKYSNILKVDRGAALSQRTNSSSWETGEKEEHKKQMLVGGHTLGNM